MPSRHLFMLILWQISLWSSLNVLMILDKIYSIKSLFPINSSIINHSESYVKLFFFSRHALKLSASLSLYLFIMTSNLSTYLINFQSKLETHCI